MIPKSEQFLLDVREASKRLRTPHLLILDSLPSDDEFLNPILSASPRWLNASLTRHYADADFAGYSPPDVQAVEEAVASFAASVAAFAGGSKPTKDEFVAGLSGFRKLEAAVRSLVLHEWTAAAESVVRDAERWSAKRGWQTRREGKELTELILGDYTLQQLMIYADQSLYVFAPVARFVHGGLGAFDLSIQPSYFLSSIFRAYDKQWQIISRPETNGFEALWTESSFAEAIVELESLV